MNTNNIIIADEDNQFEGSGSGDITGPVPSPEVTPTYVDVDSLNLIPLSETAPSLNDILLYNGTFYVPTQPTISLNEDVDLTNLANGNVLVYNNINSTWENKDIDTLLNDNIQFDSINNPVNGNILSYNGTTWVPVSKEVLVNNISLTNLVNVDIDSVLDKQLLSYNSSSSKWENKTLNLLDLDNVSINNPNNKDFLVYNTTSSKWEPTSLTLDRLEEFSSAPASDKDVLAWDTINEMWIPKSILDLSSEISGNTDLLNLKDVTIVNAQNKQLLSWDSSTQKWINYSPSLVDLSDYNSSNNPNNKDILTWDSSTSTWVSTSLTPDKVFNYNIENLGINKSLVYDGDKWILKIIKLEDLIENNIDISLIPDGSTIQWNTTQEKWEFKNKSLEEVINLSNLSNDDILVYKTTSNSWQAESIQSLVQLSQDLSNLNDLNILTPEEGEVLIYNSSTNVWENKDIFLEDIKNINLTGLNNKDYLKYNSITSKWEPYSLSLENLVEEGINPNSIEDNSSLYWNSTTGSWDIISKSTEDILGFPSNTPNNSVLVYDTVTNKWTTDLVDNLFSFSNDLESLLDINISSIEANQILVYNSITSKWENKSLSLEDLDNINIEGLLDNYILSWNNSLSRWEPKSLISIIQSEFSQKEIDSLSNISISNITDKEVLIYNSTNSMWENTKLDTSSLKGLSLVGQTTDKYLTWDSLGESWVWKNYTFEDLTGVDESTLIDTNLLIWNSGQWTPIKAFELSDYVSGEIDLGELKNVTAPNKLNNQILTWDSALQNWVPKSFSDLGLITTSNVNVLGKDWVTLFNTTLNY